MNLNNFRRLIIFCAALLAGIVLGAVQGHAQRTASAALDTPPQHFLEADA